MKNPDFDIKNYMFGYTKSMKDYIQLVRTNLKPFLAIFIIISIVALAYAIYKPSIYKSTVTLKLSMQPKNILQSSDNNPTVNDLDRFVANELDVIRNSATRERVAKALIDTVESSSNKTIFKLLTLKKGETGINGHKDVDDIVDLLDKAVKTQQKPGEDIIDITVESPSPEEAAIIANTYADQYRKLNLEVNRDQLTTIRKFLEKQSKEKLLELNNAENALANFKEKDGIVALDAQSSALIAQLSQLDAQRDAAKIDLASSTAMLNQYKKQISDQDPNLANYLESQTAQSYIDVIQKQIADLQMNRDMAMANKNPDMDVSAKVKEYDKQINDLKHKLTIKINEIKTGAFASSPEQIKLLTQKMIDEEVRNHSLLKKLNELQTIISKYDGNLNTLPKKSMEFAGYERHMQSLQQLYTLVEQRYQQALINEFSQPGNVFILSKAKVPDSPTNIIKILIVLIGLITGFVVAFGYVLVKDYFDDTVKSPDDIRKKDFNLLVWIPHFEKSWNNGFLNNELVVLNDPRSPVSEAFKALRARVMMANTRGKHIKTILITSPGEGEGKTMVATNLAFSLAQLKKRTLLIDCDLRRPRLHKVMNVGKAPGLVDYLMDGVSLDDVARRPDMENLLYMTSGSLALDPTEIFNYSLFENFLGSMRSQSDFVIIDSAPIVAVVDSEILAKYVDGVILVVSADATESKVMSEAVNLIQNTNTPILGTVLNNFKYKNGYKYYYKYHYNYLSN